MLPERQLTFHVDIADVLTLFYRNQLIEKYFTQVHINALKMIEFIDEAYLLKYEMANLFKLCVFQPLFTS